MSKKIIICSDGTWNDPNQKDRGKYRPSNVVKMARAVAPDDRSGRPQVVFYDPGVGTGGWWDKINGGITGAGLDKNVEDAYVFLINNYQPGDDVFCFGFSRGAYTVRSLGGMIAKVGLLKKAHWPLYHEACKLYRDRKLAPESRPVKQFREAYTQPCPINVMGVWDTVGALGLPVGFLRKLTMKRHQFHDVTLGESIRNAFHALAIDERRKPFEPAIWERKNVVPNQTVEQVWFAGVHSNIGGGYEDTGLSDLAFLWMVQKSAGCGLTFDEDYLRDDIRKGIDRKYAGELRNSMTWYYRLLRPKLRTIGKKKHAAESVSWAAYKRMADKIKGYAPKNLIEAHENGVPEIAGPKID